MRVLLTRLALTNYSLVVESFFVCQRFFAAALAISARRSGVIAAARALPPFRPSSAAALDSSRSSSISPVAIFATIIARLTASAGRFSPRGPLGIRRAWQHVMAVFFNAGD